MGTGWRQAPGSRRARGKSKPGMESARARSARPRDEHRAKTSEAPDERRAGEQIRGTESLLGSAGSTVRSYSPPQQTHADCHKCGTFPEAATCDGLGEHHGWRELNRTAPSATSMTPRTRCVFHLACQFISTHSSHLMCRLQSPIPQAWPARAMYTTDSSSTSPNSNSLDGRKAGITTRRTS